MKSRNSLLLITAFVLASATAALGQSNHTPPATAPERPAAVPHTSGSGTEPSGLGSTGWVGGNRGTTRQETTGQRAVDPERASQQPEMATGRDLNGSPTRFPANRTPE